MKTLQEKKENDIIEYQNTNNSLDKLDIQDENVNMCSPMNIEKEHSHHAEDLDENEDFIKSENDSKIESLCSSQQNIQEEMDTSPIPFNKESSQNSHSEKITS